MFLRMTSMHGNIKTIRFSGILRKVLEPLQSGACISNGVRSGNNEPEYTPLQNQRKLWGTIEHNNPFMHDKVQYGHSIT